MNTLEFDLQKPLRPIRSFVRREGRMTLKQRWALEVLRSKYCLDATAPWDPSCFPKSAPLIVEIGFGGGETLLQMAEQTPEKNFLGIEVYQTGIGSLLAGIYERKLQNIRVVQGDAAVVLKHWIPDHSLQGIQIFFPDPWPKKRHHKRRLIQPAFGALAAEKMVVGGHLHLATDWQDYAEQMMEVLETCEGFENMGGPKEYIPRPDFRPETKFERRGKQLGHGVWDLMYRRTEKV